MNMMLMIRIWSFFFRQIMKRHIQVKVFVTFSQSNKISYANG